MPLLMIAENRFLSVVASKGTLGTNILLRLVFSSHPPHADAFADVHKIRLRVEQLAFLPQVLYEFWAVANRFRQSYWQLLIEVAHVRLTVSPWKVIAPPASAIRLSPVPYST